MDKLECPSKQKPICEMCGAEVSSGLTLCNDHLKIRYEEQFKIMGYVTEKTNKD